MRSWYKPVNFGKENALGSGRSYESLFHLYVAPRV
jgi:hypothetical protein